MAASKIGDHVTIGELKERFELREVEGETWVVYRASGKRAGNRMRDSHKTGVEYRILSMFTASGQRKRPLEHVVVFALHHGRWPLLEVDHRDGRGLNNNPDNLREATHAQNIANTKAPRTNSSGSKGVRLLKCGRLRFEARYNVTLNPGEQPPRMRYYSRCFADSDSASRYYQSLVTIHHGDFARA